MRNKPMNFGQAIECLKAGCKVARTGWNGRGMFVVYQKGYPEGIPCNKNTAEAWGMEEGEMFRCEPYLQIKMVNGSHAMWVPSINDLLAEDWLLAEPEGLSEPELADMCFKANFPYMKTFIGAKVIKAMPMDRDAYNRYRGWETPANENPNDEGYMVEYLDGGKSNHPDHKGYISWSPKDVFENTYREVNI